jgi:hypothetical protein
VTIDGDPSQQQVEATDAEQPTEYVGEAPASRDIWDWMQLIGLGLLAAGVAVLVVFALTLGGR